MDGRTIYSKCIKMLKEFSGKELTLEELRKIIIMNAGSNETTINMSLKTMGETGLIQDLGNSRFLIK